MGDYHYILNTLFILAMGVLPGAGTFFIMAASEYSPHTALLFSWIVCTMAGVALFDLMIKAQEEKKPWG